MGVRQIFREGQKFGKLTAIEYFGYKKYLCKCDCGNEKIVASGNLANGNVRSCGCLYSIHRQVYDEDIKLKLMSYIKLDENGCWVWQKAKHKQGYGNFSYKRKCLLAHRVSWMLHYGELDKDILVLHKCDNPPCVNPEHLFLGTDRDNVKDSISKGRFTRAKGEGQWFSKLTDENVLEIRKMAFEGIMQKDIAKKFGMDWRHIGAIIRKQSWKHIQ